MRTLAFLQPSGSRWSAERDLATKDSPQGFGGHRSDRSAAQLGWPPGLGHSSGNDPSL